jgi:hypothetical protein
VNRAAAILAWTVGVGFGVFAVIGTVRFAEDGKVWKAMGFPAFGDGPFERTGVSTSIPLVVGFVAVCAAEVVAGAMLWSGKRSARSLAVALLPFEFAYWVGFALPYGLVLGFARAVVVVMPLRSRS